MAMVPVPESLNLSIASSRSKPSPLENVKVAAVPLRDPDATVKERPFAGPSENVTISPDLASDVYHSLLPDKRICICSLSTSSMSYLPADVSAEERPYETAVLSDTPILLNIPRRSL